MELPKLNAFVREKAHTTLRIPRSADFPSESDEVKMK